MSPAKPYVTEAQFEVAREFVTRYTHRTPMLRSAQLSTASGFDILLKAEMFQRTGAARVKAIVVMAENATPSKIAATKGYGAEVILHGMVWDEANEVAKRLVTQHGYTFLHPFDDPDLIAGQDTLGLEVSDDVPDVAVVVVPIGGGGLI
jgi:threonine dehydratase